jgi:hypothetical protein
MMDMTMSVTLQFRKTLWSLATVVALDDLKARIRCGEIGPKARIRDRVLTNGQWWTLDNLNLFHKSSPMQHPAGKHLLKKQAIAEQRAAQRVAIQHDDYQHGHLIDKRFNLTPLTDLVKETSVWGTTRLRVLPSFSPERIFTFIFGQHSIRIEAVLGRTSLWYSPREFDAAQVHRTNTEVRVQDAPDQFKQWTTVVMASQLAPSCSAMSLDGVGYWHELLCQRESFDAQWHNPDPIRHPRQVEILKSYRDFLLIANVDQFWQQ